MYQIILFFVLFFALSAAFDVYDKVKKGVQK